MKYDPYASHLPALSYVLKKVGHKIDSILEIGCGFYSTPLLSVFAAASKCEHIILESNQKWRKEIENLFHVLAETHTEVKLADKYLRHWGLAFIDGGIASARSTHASQLREFANVIILHDSNPDWEKEYGYSSIIPAWRHHRQFTECYPHSLLLTNDEESWANLL